ncbi:MAG: hypothetical protein AAGG01_04405, partial [Planctomycetota bacterium]
QPRAGAATPWGTCVQRHAGHTALGGAAGLAAWRAAPDLFPWLLPTLVGLCLSIPLSRLSGSSLAGAGLRRLGLVRLPEEESVPRILREQATLRGAFERRTAGAGGLRWLLARRGAAADHFGLAGAPLPHARGEPSVARLSARAKVADARTLEELETWLTRPEELAILGDVELFRWVATLPASQPTVRHGRAGAEPLGASPSASST